MTKISESAIRDYKPEAEISQAEFELGVQFLLADFNSIREFKKQSVAIGDKRVDVFLALA